MEFTYVKYIPEQLCKKKLDAEIAELLANKEVKALMVLATEGCDVKYLLKTLEKIEMPVFGGIFPGIVHNRNKYHSGFVLIGITCDFDLTIIENIHQNRIEDKLNPELIEQGFLTILVFVDGFSTHIGELIESLFNIYGIELNFIGGGAGSLQLVQKPCILTNKGLLQDAAVVIALKAKSSIAVKHGWQKLAGPFKVSLSDRNKLKMLGSKNAYDLYKEIIENDGGFELRSNNFFDFAKSYPFGLNRLGAENIVRDPVAVDKDKSIICVGDIPQNSLVNILKGDKNNLLDAAKEAVAFAKQNLNGQQASVSFVVDCISRVLFLDDDYIKELAEMQFDGFDTIGILSIGEIANSGKDFLEFYNKTCVISLIEKL